METENKKCKLRLKDVSKPNEPFEIRSLDKFREVGSYTWIAEKITDEMGFPDCVNDTDDCHCCEGQLFVLRHGGAEETNQSTDSFGQVLTMINHETGNTNIFTRAVHPLDSNEWQPWQMVATGDPKLIAENNSINEILSTLRQQVENNSKRIDAAEISSENILKLRGVNIEYTGTSTILSNALKFLRIETNNPDVDAIDFRVTTLVKNHTNPVNRFGLGTSIGKDLWMTGDDILDGRVHSKTFDVTLDGEVYYYTLYFQIDGSAIPGNGIIITSYYDDSPYSVLKNAVVYNNEGEIKQFCEKQINAFPVWLDYINSTNITETNKIFFNNVGNLTIDGFDKSLKLGIYSFVKGSTAYGNRIGFTWLKNDTWVKGAQTKVDDFTSPFAYIIDGTEYYILIDVNKVADSDSPYISDAATVTKIKLNDRYFNELSSSKISVIREEVSSIHKEISGTGSLNFLKNPDAAYNNQEKLIITAIKNIGFYNVPDGIKNDEIFMRSFSAQSTTGSGAFGQLFYFANKRIYNETKDWNKASILIAPQKPCDYREHEFDVTVSSGEMAGMRIRVLVDYSIFAGQEFIYGTNINNKLVFNLEKTWYEPLSDKIKNIESTLSEINDEDNNLYPMEQRNVVWLGSSNVWGDGFLYYSYLKTPLEWLYKSSGTFTAAEDAVATNATVVSNTKKFLGNAIKITGLGSTVSFKHKGSELNICQVIERNHEYAVIGLYVGETKVAEFTNHNNTVGSDSAMFTGNGSQTKFNLDRCFTYNHTLTVDGVEKNIVLNTGGYGASFPVDADCVVIRAINPDGNKVIHSLWFKEAPASGADIRVSYDYGETICFVKSTVGETVDGVNESPYGDGTISYDPNNPSNIGSGLDFRLVNENSFYRFWFDSDIEREITLKIERGSENPYFVFNFASSVYHNVMNAGIGGYLAATFNTKNDLTAWYNIAQYFTPDFVSIGLTGNDDKKNFPRKINRVVNMSLAELREYPSLEIGKIEYKSSDDTYDVTLNSGVISEISARSLKSASIVGSDVAEGDFVRIGTYTGDLRQVQTRRVKTADTVNGEITWDEPLHLNEFICLDNLQELVGQDVSIRSIEQYMTNMEQLIGNILSIAPKCKVCLFNVYYVDMWMRNTAEYTYIQQWIASKFPANVFVVDAWRYSRDYVECSHKSRTISITADGSNELRFSSPSTLGHWEGIEVWVDDRNVYGTDCYAVTGYKNTVNPNKSGAELNWEDENSYLAPYTVNEEMRIKWMKNVPASGTAVTIKLAYRQWSTDWGHPENGDYIDSSLGRAMIYALKR